jgi:TolB-like protein/class 3 adenylate cyclase/Tfp pilus assembly protein PilF
LAFAERRLAAIVLADIAGYSALMEREETRTFARLRALREELINPKVAEFGGRIVKTTGDGFLAEFPSATSALGCAIAIQRQNFAQESTRDEAERFRLRIGVNLGDIIRDGEDVSGDGVNVAARLEPLAPPDGICVSGAVRDQLREDLGVVLEDLGEQHVKNIARPIRAYRINLANTPVGKSPRRAKPRSPRWAAVGASLALAIVLAAGALLVWSQFSRPTRPPLSLVVLPFNTVSHDPEQDAFADGLTEDLTNALGHEPGSFVISSNTALTYKGKPIDVRQIGRELGVRYALEGNIQRLGDSVRVGAQLINAETGGQMWADQFDGDVTRLAALQDDVRARVARSMDLALVADEGRRSQSQPDNRDAVGLTYQGRAITSKGLSADNLNEGRKLFDRALEISPDYAQALIDRAWTDIAEDTFFHGAISLDKAEQWLERAREIAPDNVWGQHQTAALFLAKGDYDRAALFAERAIALNPSFSYAYSTLGFAKIAQGKAADTIPLFERAIRLGPRDPFIDVFYRGLGTAYLLSGKDADSIPWLEKAIATNDKVWLYHRDLASAYALGGRVDAARREVEAMTRLYPGLTMAKIISGSRRFSSNEAFLKQCEHIYAGLRVAGLPET